MAYPLTANGTTTGSIMIVAIQPNPVPLSSRLNPAGRRGGAALALAGLVMLGLGRRRRGSRSFLRATLALGIMMGLAGLGLCGCGGPPTLTPGTYMFMLNATSVATPVLTASTTANVTVPAGVVTKSNN
jgi:drug/metabolite transporter (DMT)-like permease